MSAERLGGILTSNPPARQRPVMNGGIATTMICPSCNAENEDSHVACFTCGQSLVAAPTLGRGAVVASRYEILASLGKGGMGIVFRAHDRVLDETVALKVLRSDVARNPTMERRFRSEIKLARKVRHRNVCGIHEYGEDGPLRYIAMELIEGTDLKQLLRQRGPFPLGEAFEISIQLAKGLDAIHDVGVIHRDLKTSNVMLDAQGQVRLMDFGIAKQHGMDVSLAATAIGHIVGTPEYMSPEQARGEKIDFRSDLYSLGVVIYEIFTGHVPFQGDTPIATIFKTLEEPPTLEGPMAAGIPGPLVSVLAQALAKSQAERYRTARDLITALREAREACLPEGQTTSVPGPLKAGELPTMVLESGVTSVPQLGPEPTPTPPPLPTLLPSRGTPPSAASAAPRSGSPPSAASVPPPPAWARDRAVAQRSRAAGTISDRTLPQRSVLPWIAMAGVAFLVVASGVVFGLRAMFSSPTASPPGVEEPRAAVVSPPDVTSEPAKPVAAPSPAPSAPEAPATPAPKPRRASPPPAEARRAALPSPRATPAATERTSAPLTPVPSSAATPVAAAQAEGLLQLRVKPWAAVSIDEEYVGTTPLRPIHLSPGPHDVRLSHPDYRDLQRKVTIRPGETARLEVDMQWEAVPKGP